MASVLCPNPTNCAYPAEAISSSEKRAVHFPSSPTKSGFAFARLKGSIHLVYIPTTAASSAPAVDVKVFRHEFITIFRLSHCETIHPSDIRILEPIDDRLTRYEEDNDTVFLAKELTERLHQMTTLRLSRAMAAPRRRLQPSHR